jgi:hypothetical protein
LDYIDRLFARVSSFHFLSARRIQIILLLVSVDHVLVYHDVS